jgi:hypothetical protein
MIVAIHQPHFFPWPGYLDRMLRADLFILLDHVQYENRNYQNRARIRVDGRAQWLSVPLVQRSQSERIVDKRIDNPPETAGRWWGVTHFQTLRHAYRGAPHFAAYADRLQQLLGERRDALVDLDLASLGFLRDAFGIDTPMVRSSTLGVSARKSELIVELCRAVGADAYLAGMGGSRDYLDRDAFAAAGIRLLWQDYRQQPYRQCGEAPFIAGLSALDLLFNCGPAPAGLPLHAESRRTPQLVPASSAAPFFVETMLTRFTLNDC